MCSSAELSEPARAVRLIPLCFNLGKCHCALVLGSDISDPVKHGAISIGTAHAERRGPVMVNVNTGRASPSLPFSLMKSALVSL